MNSSIPLAASSAATLGQLLRSGALDAVALTEYFIGRIETCADQTVFISTCFARARQEAAQSAARYRAGRPLGPLDGVPVAWKDLVDIAGLPTTAGSALYRNAPAALSDAPIVRRLAAAGMVMLGKTNLSEFAYTALGLNPHFGTPANPRAQDVARAPGGSSSGSAVAVAAGLAPVAIGTDTGGSVRTPAAFNGIVGYKSSEHRFDGGGVFPLSTTLDTIGVFAHDVQDCRLLDQALRGVAPGANAQPVPMAGLDIIVADNAIHEHLEDEVRANFFASIDRLQQAGVRIVRRAVPEFGAVRALIARHGNIAAAEAYRFHHALIEGSDHGRIDPAVYQRILGGKAMQAHDLAALLQGRAALQQSLWQSAGNALFAMPTVPHVAPPIAQLQADPQAFTAAILKTITNTMLGSMLNLCGLALPNGTGAAGMPTSILFCARNGREEHLLGIGDTLARLAAP